MSVCLSHQSGGGGEWVGWIFSGKTQWRFNQLTQQINGLFDTCSFVIIFSLQSFTRSSSSTAKAGKLITLKTEAAISYGEKRPLKGLSQPHLYFCLCESLAIIFYSEQVEQRKSRWNYYRSLNVLSGTQPIIKHSDFTSLCSINFDGIENGRGWLGSFKNDRYLCKKGSY